MILNSLVKHYNVLLADNKVPKRGWSIENISYGLYISKEGTLLDLIPLFQTKQRGNKTVEVPTSMFVPERVIKSSGIKANFLVDNASYLLGLDSKKGQEKFHCARALHFELLNEIDNKCANSIKAFFRTWDINTAKENRIVNDKIKELESGANLIFMTEGMASVLEDEAICNAWDNHYIQREGQTSTCLVTGENDYIAELHGKIKGVKNTLSVGANLISTNKPAFHSYGLETAMPSAPIGDYAMSAYTKALNYLISSNKNREIIGDNTVLFWAEDGNEKAEKVGKFSLFMNSDIEEDIKGVFEKITKGNPINEFDLDGNFTILGISPNIARLSVAFFYQTSFRNFIFNINEHYKRLDIIKPKQVTQPYMSIRTLLDETRNPKSKDENIPDYLMTGMFKAIINNSYYPNELLASIISRVKKDRDNGQYITKINWRKAAIIKACLIKARKNKKEEVIEVALNESNTNQAYLLGRLFSILENIQTTANPGIKTTIKDRFFNSACATPRVAFPRLMQLSQSHMKVIKRDKAGIGINLEKDISSVMKLLADAPFPAHLDLESQGMFILGYYQQTQQRYLTKEERENGSN